MLSKIRRYFYLRRCGVFPVSPELRRELLMVARRDLEQGRKPLSR